MMPEVRDALGDLAALGYSEVVCKPIVCNGNDTSLALIVDLGVRGFGFQKERPV